MFALQITSRKNIDCMAEDTNAYFAKETAILWEREERERGGVGG